MRWLAALVVVMLAACSSAEPLPDPGPTPSSESPTSAAPASPPRPQVRGNELVDLVTGRTWVPRGVNWPDLEYACVQGWTPADRHRIEETLAMAEWGIDTVRVPLNQDCWLGADGAPVSDGSGFASAAAYRQHVAERVSLAHEAGLAVILDLHWSAPDGSLAENGQRAMPDSQSLDFWRSVAGEFRDDESVLFDVFNEPFSPAWIWATPLAVDWACWRDGGCRVPDLTELGTLAEGTPTYAIVGMSQLVEAIRQAGATQPIILSGLEYANDLTAWLDHRPADDQLIAGWHNYAHQTCERTCWDETITPVAEQVPVLMTETGWAPDDQQWLRDSLAWAQGKGIGQLVWAWWQLDADDVENAPYDLIEDDFTPRDPAGAALHEHLSGLRQ
jgi:hypothetical protein